MNILQICFVYPPSFSGYGRQLQTINEEIVSREDNIKIEVITSFDRNYHSKNRNHQAINVNALFKNSRSYYKKEAIMFYFYCLVIPFIYMRLFYKADIIHIVKAGPEAFFTLFLAKIFRKKVIIKVAQDEMDPVHLNGFKQFLRKLRFKAITKATKVIAISSKIKRDLINAGLTANKIVSIPNAVNSDKFKQISNAGKKELKKTIFHNENLISTFHFIYLGSISKRKGVHDLLNALEYLNSSQRISISFIGPDYNDVDGFHETIKKINNTQNNINAYYIPFTEDPQSFIHVADCLILPSYSEGLPNVVLESLSCGVPVLVSDIPIHKELVTNDIGALFSVGDEIDLANKMNQIVNDANNLKQKGFNARQMIEKNYSSKKIADSYHSVYKELIEST